MPKIEVTVELHRADNKAKRVFDIDDEAWVNMSEDERNMLMLERIGQQLIIWDYYEIQ